jgi:hypothetical protein
VQLWLGCDAPAKSYEAPSSEPPQLVGSAAIVDTGRLQRICRIARVDRWQFNVGTSPTQHRNDYVMLRSRTGFGDHLL